MEWNKVMNFGDPSTFGTEMADRFVASGANLPPLFNIGLIDRFAILEDLRGVCNIGNKCSGDRHKQSIVSQ